MAEDERSTRWAFAHDGPFVVFARYSVLVVPIAAAVMFVIAMRALLEWPRNEARWFWLLMAVWGATFVVLGIRRFRTVDRAVRALTSDPGGLSLTPDLLIIECPALLTSPLVVQRTVVEAIHANRPPVGFSMNHGTRFTLSMRRPHARVQIDPPVPVPQARNVQMASSPYTLPSRRRSAPSLVFRFVEPDGALEALQQWLSPDGDVAEPPV